MRFPTAPWVWQAGLVTDADQTDWLTVPDLVELLGQTPSRIRRLIDDRHLLAKRVEGVLKVPAVFLRDDAPVPELHGTAMVLADAGFTDEEALEWMLAEEDSLGTTPIAALRAGRKSEVRRVAQALA
ncbi:MAG: DNA-binding protein [Agromyces sp.]|nr:DNA-binding protein [Agromyces sp.]